MTRARDGRVEVVFQLPTHSLIGDMLRNPIYAGAYVYGRRPTELKMIDGRPVKRQGRLRPPTEAQVCIPDHHAGYIDWATYEEHQRMMRRNSLRHEGQEGTGAVRAGHGLLARLLRCGRCGRKLHVRYWGKHGMAARYLALSVRGGLSGGRPLLSGFRREHGRSAHRRGSGPGAFAAGGAGESGGVGAAEVRKDRSHPEGSQRGTPASLRCPLVAGGTIPSAR